MKNMHICNENIMGSLLLYVLRLLHVIYYNCKKYNTIIMKYFFDYHFD